MNEKKAYLCQLANFLVNHEMVMSGEELADHLNRNDFLTEYGAKYQGGRGTYTLIRETYKWLNEELQLDIQATKFAKAFVDAKGNYAYERNKE